MSYLNEQNATSISKVFNFSSNNQPVRTALVNGEPYFATKDICACLGLDNSSQAISKLDEDEKGVIISDTLGGKQSLSAINESGLYNLIFQSRKPQAKAFRRWVTGEVLPTLRKTGRYAMSPKSLSGGSFIDLRSKPHELRNLNGYPIRTITYEDVAWYSVKNVNRAIGSSTESSQSVMRLRNGGCRAEQFLLFGSTNPAWFIPLPGVQMLLLGSRKVNSADIAIMIGGLEHGTL